MKRSLALSAILLSAVFGAPVNAQTLNNTTVAFLMPDQASTRYEQHDYPGFVAQISVADNFGSSRA